MNDRKPPTPLDKQSPDDDAGMVTRVGRLEVIVEEVLKRLDRLDVKCDKLDAKIDARFDRLDGKFDTLNRILITLMAIVITGLFGALGRAIGLY